MLLSLYGKAQSYGVGCATPDSTDPDPIGVYSHSIDPSYLDNFDPVVFNVFFWGIHTLDANGNEFTHYPNHLNDFLTAIANLNKVYNEFNIFFKYKGYDTFISPQYYTIDSISEYAQLFSFVQSNGYVEPNSFNVYAYAWGVRGGAVPWSYSTISAISTQSALKESGMIHEIGHNLNLWHLDNGSGAPCLYQEHVTRDPLNDDFNADIRGDQVVDTPACYEFEPEEIAICQYIGNKVDCTEDQLPYVITEPDLRNYLMRYAESCEKKFLTTGQGIRMKEAIEDDRNGIFSDAQTSFAALYKPYKGSYPMYYPMPGPYTKPLFQPGFDYRFVECCCDFQQPAPYGSTNFTIDPNNILKIVDRFEFNYETIFHPNHSAIIIDQVDNAFQEYNHGQRCYDNYYSPPIIGGTLIRFNDNIVNNNVTITPKDSTGINNPNLINELNPGLYNIRKDFIDGSSEENLIYKEN